jgi:hypothetical protein
VLWKPRELVVYVASALGERRLVVAAVNQGDVVTSFDEPSHDERADESGPAEDQHADHDRRV